MCEFESRGRYERAVNAREIHGLVTEQFRYRSAKPVYASANLAGVSNDQGLGQPWNMIGTQLLLAATAAGASFPGGTAEATAAVALMASTLAIAATAKMLPKRLITIFFLCRRTRTNRADD